MFAFYLVVWFACGLLLFGYLFSLCFYVVGWLTCCVVELWLVYYLVLVGLFCLWVACVVVVLCFGLVLFVDVCFVSVV